MGSCCNARPTQASNEAVPLALSVRSTFPSFDAFIRTFGIFLDPKDGLPFQSYPNSHLHGITCRTVKLAGNAEPDDVLQEELRDYLAQFGVRVGPSLEAMMRRFARHDLGEMDMNPFEVDAHLFDLMDDWM